MKNIIKLCFLATIILLPFSCDVESVDANDGIEDLINNRSSATTVMVHDMYGDIPGTSSTLWRNNRGITASFHTKNLIPGNTYTLWWVIFNDPSTPGPPSAVLFAAGHIAGESGKSNFSARLNADFPEFDNPQGAEVHVALRGHGPAVPSMLPDQIDSYEGGCTESMGVGGGVLLEDPTEVGYCQDFQAAIHSPVN